MKEKLLQKYSRETDGFVLFWLSPPVLEQTSLFASHLMGILLDDNPCGVNVSLSCMLIANAESEHWFQMVLIKILQWINIILIQQIPEALEAKWQPLFTWWCKCHSVRLESCEFPQNHWETKGGSHWECLDPEFCNKSQIWIFNRVQNTLSIS